MATASRIGIQAADGSIRSIYVYSDGYPTGVGATLAHHYPTADSFEPVLALGDLSVLGPVPGDAPMTARAPFQGPTQCEAYHRDRGERRRPARHHLDDGDLVRACDVVSYVYLLWNDGTWRVTRPGCSNEPWRELPDAIRREQSYVQALRNAA